MSKRTLFNYYSSGNSSIPEQENAENARQPKLPRVEFHCSDIISDPGLRKPIDEYPFEIRDQVKRAYALRGPTQPIGYTFPCKWQSGEWRSFQQHWFESYDWLEYSESKDTTFCLYRYLFFEPGKSEKFGSSVFAKVGYEKWKKALERFEKHAASLSHRNARMKCDDFMNQKTNVSQKVEKYSKEEEDVVRFLIMQGDAFHGHDESSTSNNKGTFREMVDWYKDKVETVKEAYDNGAKNYQMLSHHIQKDLTKACAEEVMAVIMDEICGRKFSILIDESRDVSIKEQMAVILRFVNDEGKVLERFLGLQHIERCTAIALKEALVSMISSHKLSISMLRGQGYDGASNMRGEFNGVQKLIRDENPYAFYVHCFAHQLQLVIFFNYVPLIVNTVGASCMRKDALLEKQHDVLLEKESNLARPGDTRWGSHLKTSLRILVIDSIKLTCNGGAFGLIGKMESFDFVFILHLMIDLLSITNSLSQALQRKDQDIVEAIHLIIDVKEQLQDMRENGWDPIFKRAKLFCDKNEIKVPNIDKEVNARGTSALSSELNSFSNFDVDKLVKLAEMYAEDYNIDELLVLPRQLKEVHSRVKRSSEFLGCSELPKVAEIMVKKGMNMSYPLVYRLIELTLILPVATASVERVFSAMSLIKTDLRNKMEDEWLNDLMICYVEKEIFRQIRNEKILKRFEDMKKRRMLISQKNKVTRPPASY
ncbi:hypothetical protein BS78_03G085400 [Paspalum vaginatum]|nr:hypothetical protein BS78_03G085400 [Paspalum vaginatum]